MVELICCCFNSTRKIRSNIFLYREIFASSTFNTPLVLASFFQGMYQPYLSFLTSKGIPEIKYTAFISSVVNLLENIILIPLYGAMGASIASLFSMGAWYIVALLFYNKWLKECFRK